jgi:hypothetical protein
MKLQAIILSILVTMFFGIIALTRHHYHYDAAAIGMLLGALFQAVYNDARNGL